MRKYINFIKVSLVFVVFGLTGCYEQEVAPIVEPGGLGYTSATFTSDFTGDEVVEGDTITYTITLSKPIGYDLTFEVNYEGNPDDVEITPCTIPAYSTEGELQIVFVLDNIPEKDVPIKMEIGVFDIGTKNLLFDTTNPVLNLTLKNKNATNGLTVAVKWPDSHDDWDAYIIDAKGNGTEYNTDWVAFEGATGDNPEIMIFDAGNYPWDVENGIYYVDLDPYDVASEQTDFTISVG